MNIYGINGMRGVAPVRRAGVAEQNKATQRATSTRDEMNVSSTRETTANANANSDIRVDLVNRVRAEIAAGTYYTDEKFEIALNRMFESFE